MATLKQCESALQEIAPGAEIVLMDVVGYWDATIVAPERCHWDGLGTHTAVCSRSKDEYPAARFWDEVLEEIQEHIGKPASCDPQCPQEEDGVPCEFWDEEQVSIVEIMQILLED